MTWRKSSMWWGSLNWVGVLAYLVVGTGAGLSAFKSFGSTCVGNGVVSVKRQAVLGAGAWLGYPVRHEGSKPSTSTTTREERWLS